MNKAAHKHKRAGDSKAFNPNHLALPEEEIRQLVLQITDDGNAEKFIRRMVTLMDAVKAGQTSKVKQVAKQSKDASFVRLMRAISTAAKEGRLIAASNTAFYAANYAFQNSLDYVRVLMLYLDSFRQSQKAEDNAPSRVTTNTGIHTKPWYRLRSNA